MLFSNYSFNGKEKDDEWSGDGNSYDFGDRMLDSRLGRWLSIDPIFQKYPFVSPFSAFLNSPLFFSDANGDTLRVGGHMDQVKADVKSFVPKSYQNLISFVGGANEMFFTNNEDKPVKFGPNSLIPYKVIFNITKEQAYKSGDPGVIALYEMTNSEKEMYYGAQEKIWLKDTYNQEGEIYVTNTDPVKAASKNPRAFTLDGKALGLLTTNEVDALRIIKPKVVLNELDSNGNTIPKSRASLVFHELYELYEEGVNNVYYDQRDANRKLITSPCSGSIDVHPDLNRASNGAEGSHTSSIKAEKSLKAGDVRKSENPGTLTN